MNHYANKKRFSYSAAVLASWAIIFAGTASAADITAKIQPKIDTYKKQAETWAADPDIIKAVKEANTKGPIAGMGNAKWRELKVDDPIVLEFISNATGQLLTKWMKADEKGINKIVLTGNKSHRVAFTSMPAIYIGKGKPNFDTSFSDGKTWQQGESKPDPSTNIDSVQISAPVKDGDTVIGVLLVALTMGNL